MSVGKRLPMKAVSAWRRELAKGWGTDRADRLMRRVQARFAALRRGQIRPADRRLGRHLDEHILPGLALYRELQATGMGREEGLRTAAALIAASAEERRRSYARLGRLPCSFLLLRAWIRGRLQRDYPAEGWEVEWLEVSGRRVAFDMRRCFYFDTLAGYGAPELTGLFCDYDDLLFAGMSPTIRWERRQTIARGGALCDFRFERVRRAGHGHLHA